MSEKYYRVSNGKGISFMAEGSEHNLDQLKSSGWIVEELVILTVEEYDRLITTIQTQAYQYGYYAKFLTFTEGAGKGLKV
jgi:hypothetical protein